jgi:lysozyme
MSTLADRILMEEEGYVTTAYKDSRGFLTIGVGCLVDPSVSGAGLCGAAIKAQLDNDLIEAQAEAAALKGFTDCNDVQQAVIISMCFQLGTLADWPQFKAALAAKDYVGAAEAGLDSRWAAQTPTRAKREMYMLSSGTWLDHGATIPS